MHGLDLGLDQGHLLQLGRGPENLLLETPQLYNELLPLGAEVERTAAHLGQLGGHGIDVADLGLHLQGPLVDLPDLRVPLRLDLGGGGGQAAELLLGEGELLLEGHMGGEEPLVLGEEGLDLAVLGGGAFLERRHLGEAGEEARVFEGVADPGGALGREIIARRHRRRRLLGIYFSDEA